MSLRAVMFTYNRYIRCTECMHTDRTFKDTRCESGLTVTAQWLQKISKVSARTLAGEATKIVEVTADAVGNTQDSHSLTLGLELATAIHQPVRLRGRGCGRGRGSYYDKSYTPTCDYALRLVRGYNLFFFFFTIC